MNPYLKRRRERLIGQWKKDNEINLKKEISNEDSINDKNSKDIKKLQDPKPYLHQDTDIISLTNLLSDKIINDDMWWDNIHLSKNAYITRSVNSEIKYTEVDNNVNKLFTFIMPLKNRKHRANLSIKSIVTLENSKYIDFMIVEDISDDMIQISDELKDIIKYYIVDSGVPWTRSGLLNFGMKRSTTPLLVMWDADFLFPNNFIPELIKTFRNLNIEKQYFGIPSYETHDTSIMGIEYKQGDPYGNLWIYPRESINKVKGMNEDMIGWGWEERELEIKLEKISNIIPVYTIHLNKKLMVFHYSHIDNMRSKHNPFNKNFLTNVKINNKWGEIREVKKIPKLKKKSSEYGEYLRDKRVCVVGPSPHMINSECGERIDEYDIVVRLNRAYPVPIERYKDIGSRTDILYNCLHTELDSGGVLDLESIKDNVKFISMPYPNKIPFSENITKFNGFNEKWNVPFHIIDESLYNKVEDETNTRPNTGVLSIIDLLSFDIKELYVTGFSFFRGGYDPLYRSIIEGVEVIDQKHSEELVFKRMERTGNHKQIPQIEYIKKLFRSDRRFIGDSVFNEIMNEKNNDD